MRESRKQQARLARRAARWMGAGWVLSYAGNSAVQGASPTLVLLGIAPAAWIAFYATVASVIDLSAPIAMRLIGRHRPGRILAVAEGCDTVLTASALIALLAGAPTWPVMCAYLLATAPIPLVTDVADDLYAETLTRLDEDAGFAFTATLTSIGALVGAVLGSPLGAALAFHSLYPILGLNVVTSISAVASRSRAARLADLPADEAEATAHTVIPPAPVRRFLLRHPAVSPLTTLVRTYAGGLTGTYITLAAGAYFGRSHYVACLFAVAIGNAIGAQLARHADRFHLTPARMGFATAGAVVLVIAAFWANHGWLVVAALGLLGLVSGTFAILLAFARQRHLTGALYRHASGWTQLAGAAGIMAGSWSALGLNASTNPYISLTFAVACYLAVWGYVVKGQALPAGKTLAEVPHA